MLWDIYIFGRNLDVIQPKFLLIQRSKHTKECKVVCLISLNYLTGDPGFRPGALTSGQNYSIMQQWVLV